MLTLLLAFAIAGPVPAEDWLTLLDQPVDSPAVQELLDDRYYRFVYDEHQATGVPRRRYYESDKRGVLVFVDDDRVSRVVFSLRRDGKQRPYRGDLPLGLDGDATISESAVPFVVPEGELVHQVATVGDLRIERRGPSDAGAWSFRIWRTETAVAQEAADAEELERRKRILMEAPSRGTTATKPVPAPPAPDLDPFEAAQVGTEALKRTGLSLVHTETVTVGDGSPFREGWRLEPGRLHHYFVYFRTGATTRMNVTAFSPQSTDAPNGRPKDGPQGVSIVHLPVAVDHTRDITLRVEPLYSRGVEAVVVYMTGPLSDE